MSTHDGDDPHKDCPGTGVCAGACDGHGACRYPASGLVCGQTGCSGDGIIHQPGKCDGAGQCMGDVFDGMILYEDLADIVKEGGV